MLLRAYVSATLPTPGSGIQPPGTEGVSTVLSWAAWIALALCVLGVIISGAMMALGNRRGEGAEHAGRLGMVFAACIVIGAASGLVGALV